MTLEETQGGVFIFLHVIAGAKRTEFCGIHAQRYKLKVNAPADKGKANAQIRKFLAFYFGIRLKDVQIVKGERSRAKTVLLKSINRAKALSNLQVS